MLLMRRTVTALIVMLLVATGNVGAQTLPREPDPDRVRVRFGPLWLNPSIALTNLGVDTNVFYEPDALEPERDFTITLTPQSDYWLRMGRTWVTGNVREDLVWYQTFTDERSANQNYAINWLVPFNRLSFAVGGNWMNVKERPGFEIDARARRTELAGGGAAELRALSKTLFGVRGERRRVAFDESEAFFDTFLQVEFNRTISSGALTVRHELTPLTSVNVEFAKSQDRFEFSPNRDSDSTSVNASVSFAPAALIVGSAQIGYRRFDPVDQAVPAYSGSTATVNLSHVARGSTRLGLQVLRDVQYSFEFDQPYYLQTGFTASVAQQIYGPVDVEVRGGRHALAYRDRGGPEEATRVDHIRAFGGGVGYRLGRDVRLAFNVDRQRRTSDVLSRDYEGFRFGGSVTYGL
jgi:hypothetical protein